MAALSTSKSLKTPVATKNQFDALGNQGDNLIEDMIVSEVNVVNATHEPADDGEESEVEEVNIEHSTIKVASTPSSVGNAPSIPRQLWNELDIHKHMVNNSPWIMLGDFNVALNMEDVSVGSSSMNSTMNDFKEYVANLEVLDVNCSGLHYTWNQRPKGRDGILKKLDRIMGNLGFVDKFPGAHAVFQPYRISDHSPAVLKFPTLVSNKPKPFKYYNFLAYKDKFGEVVSHHWNTTIAGHAMYKVVQKMKVLKKPLRKLLHDQGNLHDRVSKLRKELDEVQIALDKNPNDSTLRDEEAVYIQAFTDAKIDEERFLKQKAKVDWLEAGDANSAYFHKTIKSKNHRSRITSVLDANDIEVTGPSVPDVFVKHYEQFLGSNMPCEMLDVTDLFLNQVSDSSNTNMVRAISNEEIKAAMFNIGDDRAPGPDGFTSAFFKKGWDTIGMDVCNAIRDFFSNGQILKEINHTFIALIPKVPTPIKVNDFWPISCCNVIYKCISKILTNRIIDGIKEVVSQNQSAFVPCRRISDNILTTQELMHNYHRDRGPPRCDFKVDIQKAYDTVD
ncbi:aspartic peptidase [Tanacetum coccineum]